MSVVMTTASKRSETTGPFPGPQVTSMGPGSWSPAETLITRLPSQTLAGLSCWA